jgi:hypothetical protein
MAIGSTLRAAAAYVVEFVLAHFSAQRVAMNPEFLGGARLVSVGTLEDAPDKLLFEFRDSFVEQDSALDHHSD